MGKRFDEFAKALGRGMSRREAVRWIGGGFLGALAAAFGGGKASAESVYTTGCKIKCGGRTGSTFTACVNACVNCAEGGNIVCSFDNSGTIYCCSGTYRTCRAAAAKGAKLCQPF